MKALLTGANGFVGSHILDSLQARGVATSVLLRPTSDRRFIAAHLGSVEVRVGSISHKQSLLDAMRDATHVVHCAGLTKAVRTKEFFEANQSGTRNVVEAVNALGGQVQRLVYISSQAAAGTALADAPAREDSPPAPVSEYGRSKLAGEQEVRQNCHRDFVILRPPGVYGPRDSEFHRLFKAVKARVLPVIGGGRMPLSLVFVKDLAEAAATCLTHPAAAGKTYFVASPEVVTSRQIAVEIAAQMKVRTLTLPVPTIALGLSCLLQEGVSRLTGRASVLSWQKYAELKAPGWVCDPSRLRDEIGFVCGTALRDGIAQTLKWYRKEGWL